MKKTETTKWTSNVALLTAAAAKSTYADAFETMGLTKGLAERGTYGGARLNQFKAACNKFGISLKHFRIHKTMKTSSKITVENGAHRYSVSENFVKVGEVVGKTIEDAIKNFCSEYSYPEAAIAQLQVREIQ